MSDLILQWLNDEVQLSRKIVNFEQDFENGYLIGELLQKYNQQLNFQEFKDDNNRDIKINNFKLIFPTLKCLKVSFDSKVCEKIIANEKDVAKNILYQIKMALEKVHNPADKLLLGTKTTGLQSINPQKKIKVRKDQYEKMEGDFFQDMLNKGQRSQMLINQDKHLEKFNKFKDQQDVLVEECRRREREDDQKVKEEIRKIQLDKLQRNQNFMEDWKKKGLENWRCNRRKQKDREENERDFKEEELSTRREKTLLQQNSQRKEILEGLDEFEGKLQLQQQQQMQLTSSRFQQQQSINNSNEMTATQTLNKLKEQKLLSEFQKKERDKRRRKMIVDQARNQKQFEVKQREQQILNKLNRRSRQEQELQYEEWRCLQSYDLIEKSRDLREEKYKQRKDLIQLNCKYKEEELLGQYQEQFNHQLDQYGKKQKSFEIREKQIKRKDNYEECADILEAIMGIQETLYWDMQDNDDTRIEDSPVYEQAVQLFLQGDTQVPRINRGDLVDERQKEQANSLAKVQEKHYQHYLDNAYKCIDISMIPNSIADMQYEYKLDDMVSQLRQEEKDIQLVEQKEGKLKEGEYSELEQQRQLVEVTMQMQLEEQELEDGQQMPLIVSIIGKDQSGKEDYINDLSKQYAFLIITVEAILEQLMAQTTPLDPLQNKVKTILLNGQSISDQDLVHLVLKTLKSQRTTAKGFFLLDFPQNQNQWNAIEAHQVQREEPKKLINDINKLSIIHERPQVKEVQSLRESFIDLVVYVEREDKECMKKQFGRMKDQRNQQEYHLIDNKPVTDNYPMMENLAKIHEVKNTEGILINRLVGFTQDLQSLKESVCQFGYERDNQHSVFQQVDSQERVKEEVEKVMLIRKGREEEQSADREKRKGQREQEIMEISKSIEESKKFRLTEGEGLGQELAQLQGEKSKLPVESIRQMLSILEKTDKEYKQSIQESLVEIELQKKYISQYLAEMQRRFIEQLEREDQKIVRVVEYQKEYNAFLEANPDMIAEEVTKEEMHMRVGDLEQDLWEIADNKKTYMNTYKNNMQDEQFIEKQQEAYLKTVTRMVMREHARNQMISLVVNDYYHLIQGKEVNELQKDSLRQLNLLAINELPIEDLECQSNNGPALPRLSKLFEDAGKKYNQKEEEQQLTEQKGKGAKKDTKKDNKKGEVIATQENEGGSEMDKEKEVVLEVEQQIYKGRLKELQKMAEETMMAMKGQNRKIFNKLEDWVEYCFSVESKMIDELGLIFRDSIEEEKKIQNEVRVQSFRVIVSNKTLNFLTEPPKIFPALEKGKKTRFTISQLYLFMEDIKQMAYDSQYVDNNHLLAYLLNKTNALNTPDMPQAFSLMDQQQAMKLIANLDRKATGSINIHHLCLYFSLLDSPIIKLDEYLQYEQLLTSASEDKLTLEQDQFTQIEAFFDPYEEDSHKTENQRGFQRQKLIKELVFFLLKDQQTERITIQDYLDILNCEGYLQDDLDKDQISTYKNLLFN